MLLAATPLRLAPDVTPCKRTPDLSPRPGTLIFLCRAQPSRSNMRRIRAAAAATDATSRLVPPCSWRVHGESSPWEFGQYQLTNCCNTPRGAPRLGPDGLRGYRPRPVRRADLLRLGLHHAIDNIALAQFRGVLGGGWLRHLNSGVSSAPNDPPGFIRECAPSISVLGFAFCSETPIGSPTTVLQSRLARCATPGKFPT